MGRNFLAFARKQRLGLVEDVREITKRTVVLHRHPGPKPPAPTADEIFRQAYMHALGGLCSQFEQPGLAGHKPMFTEGDSELLRCRQISHRAWNVACYSRQLFEEDGQVREFNSELFESIVR